MLNSTTCGVNHALAENFANTSNQFLISGYFSFRKTSKKPLTELKLNNYNQNLNCKILHGRTLLQHWLNLSEDQARSQDFTKGGAFLEV